MSNPAALQARLKELSTTISHIHPLVEQLRNFTSSAEQSDEVRVELGVEIHAGLKDAEGELELLRGEVEALELAPENKRKTSVASEEKGAEKERVIAAAGRLAEDLKRTRGDFRNAQLQAKRNAELAKRKERELLLSRAQTSPTRQRPPSEKFTQDDLILNASNDVTAALRRTHHLMQAELSRSQFAQETLEQSTVAISSLSESYGSLDTLLTSSRSLANSLLRSQKSDTWYLETAFYILIGTIGWLLFRRILYGPLWWLVWLPLQFSLKALLAVIGVVGITGQKSVQVSSSPVADGVYGTIQTTSTTVTVSSVPTNKAVWEDQPSDQPSDQPADDEEDRLIDKIGHAIDDILPDEKESQDQNPRNPMKRMYEAEEPVNDEL
ncbi:hypothetical protein N7495_009410 [Penicillium taxi]|uniref:uncharacterized protein n=1 Tax=Penicillium taxi TaxID=168475 RepID=UPI002545B386|nr:uncharacterized protein N7495_009410 [Penicillium taxi]KAJ5884900.1 hypothetical protein N7495_009410 [Penicillium taxi]